MIKCKKYDNDCQFKIDFRVEDKKSLNYIDFSFKHTRHSYVRSSQRGINSFKIKATLQYGDTVYKQGLIYFILGESNIPTALQKDTNKLKNTVVVVSGNSNEVITCYRSSNPFRHIKQKSSMLYKNYKHAA